MNRVWLYDLQLAIEVLREKLGIQMFVSVTNNINGDFVFVIDDDLKVVVDHNTLAVWKAVNNSDGEWWEILVPPSD